MTSTETLAVGAAVLDRPMATAPRVAAVLFDLDGTLVDSAPDLAGAANGLRLARGLSELPLSDLRPMVGAGARGMVGAAFGLKPGDDGFDLLRDEFLLAYEQRLLQATGLFPAMVEVLQALEAAGLPWGVVTNKAERFTLPLVKGLSLHTRAAAVVCGDTTPHAKPHPAPLLEAARRMGVAPAHCVYVGDDLRDMQAGRAAGMPALAAAWGYLGQGEPVHAWGADAVLESPLQLLSWLQLP
jgi:phosphoglycolate phosphatase